MLLAFTDESYSEDRFYQAAYVIHESQLQEVENRMLEAKSYAMRFGVKSETEFHGHRNMNHLDGWQLSTEFKEHSAS
jgi:hypothetical protein